MPQVVICKSCGQVLYRGIELKPADEVIQQYAGACPRCGRKLDFSVEDVEIRPQ